jgi:hypothetical protein
VVDILSGLPVSRRRVAPQLGQLIFWLLVRYNQKLWIGSVKKAAYPSARGTQMLRLAGRRKETPPMLKVLDNDRADNDRTADERAAPTLDALVSDGYLRAIPEDPFTLSTTSWRTVFAEPDFDNPTVTLGVFDVQSGSEGAALDGTPYAEW